MDKTISPEETSDDSGVGTKVPSPTPLAEDLDPEIIDFLRKLEENDRRNSALSATAEVSAPSAADPHPIEPERPDAAICEPTEICYVPSGRESLGDEDAETAISDFLTSLAAEPAWELAQNRDNLLRTLAKRSEALRETIRRDSMPDVLAERIRRHQRRKSDRTMRAFLEMNAAIVETPLAPATSAPAAAKPPPIPLPTAEEIATRNQQEQQKALAGISGGFQRIHDPEWELTPPKPEPSVLPPLPRIQSSIDGTLDRSLTPAWWEQENLAAAKSLAARQRTTEIRKSVATAIGALIVVSGAILLSHRPSVQKTTAASPPPAAAQQKKPSKAPSPPSPPLQPQPAISCRTVKTSPFTVGCVSSDGTPLKSVRIIGYANDGAEPPTGILEVTRNAGDPCKVTGPVSRTAQEKHFPMSSSCPKKQ